MRPSAILLADEQLTLARQQATLRRVTETAAPATTKESDMYTTDLKRRLSVARASAYATGDMARYRRLDAAYRLAVRGRGSVAKAEALLAN